jgi:hypothetical protein
VAQLLQYTLSDGQIYGVYEANTAALLEVQIVEDDPIYGYLIPLSPFEMDRQDEYEVVSEVVVPKVRLRLTASPSPFVADGVVECAITVTPFVECAISVNGLTTPLTTGDPTLIVTADTPQTLQVRLVTMPGYYADAILIRAVATMDATALATGGISLGGADVITAGSAILQATGGPLIQGSAPLESAAATVAGTTSLTTLLTADLVCTNAQLTGASTVAVSGEAAPVMAGLSLASIGTLPLAGLLHVTEAARIVTSSGVLPLAGSLPLTLALQACMSLGSLPIAGASSMIAGAMTLDASGSPPRFGTSTLTVASMHAMGQGA